MQTSHHGPTDDKNKIEQTVMEKRKAKLEALMSTMEMPTAEEEMPTAKAKAKSKAKAKGKAKAKAKAKSKGKGRGRGKGKGGIQLKTPFLANQRQLSSFGQRVAPGHWQGPYTIPNR